MTAVGRVNGLHGVCVQVAPMLTPAWLAQFTRAYGAPTWASCPCGALDRGDCHGGDDECGYHSHVATQEADAGQA